MRELRTLPPPALALLIAVGALLLLGLLWPADQSSLSAWPGARRAAAPTAAPTISGAARPSGGALTLRLADGLYEGQERELQAELDAALAYVVVRFGSAPSAPLTASLHRDDGCALHGITYTDIRDAQVFTCDAIARGRAVAIMAHELAHQLAQDRYGPPHLSADLILSEGVATWAAGDYWLGGQPDFRALVRERRAAGEGYPLATHYAGLGAAAMNTLYYQWASFVEYLIGAYGRERFDALYVSGAGAPGTADYQGVYGKPLAALEAEWEAWLAR